MKTPFSHKLAPFLNSLESDFQGPIAGYASYAPSVIPRSKIQDPVWNDKINSSSSIEELVRLVESQEFDLLLDLFCVDFDPQLKLFYLFKNSHFQETLQLIIDVHPNSYTPSLSLDYASANWLERECFDLFGVYFEGHPDLKRLLLYPEFAGHPLKKNYPIDKAQPLIPIYA